MVGSWELGLGMGDEGWGRSQGVREFRCQGVGINNWGLRVGVGRKLGVKSWELGVVVGVESGSGSWEWEVGVGSGSSCQA